MRLLSRAVVLEVVAEVVRECLEARGASALELLRARRAAERALADGLRARSRHVRGLTRAEFLAELARSRASFVSETDATQRALAELVGTPSAEAGTREEAVERLERRVAKMRCALEELEGRYRELAARAGEEPGLPSIYREVQGRSLPHQRAALTRVFELNLRLQRRSA